MEMEQKGGSYLLAQGRSWTDIIVCSTMSSL